MQKIINNAEAVVDEMIMGYAAVENRLIVCTANPRVLKYSRAPVRDKVGVVTGGGSGHDPAFVGYIGRNLVDAVAIGEIFSSPPAEMFLDAFKLVDAGKGVICLYGNYIGDNMNVKMAVEMATDLKIKVKTVAANDDVLSAPPNKKEERRGGAGEVLLWKVCGAKAAMQADIDQVAEVAQRAINNTRSMSIGLSSCTIPAIGKPNFHIDPGFMEVGVGHHGEPGIEVVSLESSSQIAKRMTNTVLEDLPFRKGDDVVVLISGLGSTTMMELFIFYNDVLAILMKKKINIYKSYVGNYFTSLEMAGVTLTFMKTDGEIKKCIDYECESLGLKQFYEK